MESDSLSFPLANRTIFTTYLIDYVCFGEFKKLHSYSQVLLCHIHTAAHTITFYITRTTVACALPLQCPFHSILAKILFAKLYSLQRRCVYIGATHMQKGESCSNDAYCMGVVCFLFLLSSHRAVSKSKHKFEWNDVN